MKSKKWSRNFDWRRCYRVIVVLSHFLCKRAKRPWWQVKKVPDIQKIATKSFFGSILFGKVEGEKFSFSACTLIHTYIHTYIHKYIHKSAVKSDHTFLLLASDSYGQVSLDRSQIVDVVDQTGRDWWKVSDAMGRQGYYPSHYLKII